MRTAQAIHQLIERLRDGMWTTGTVTAVGVGSPVLVTVTVAGGSSLQLAKLASYTPTVGDVVQIAWPTGRPFVLGKLG